jgi:hypothetical protein
MERIRQVREVIWNRQSVERKQRLRVEEMKVQAITAAVHAAAGNGRGAKAAMKFRLTPPEKGEVSAEYLERRFPVDDDAGLITPEQVHAEQVRLGLVES